MKHHNKIMALALVLVCLLGLLGLQMAVHRLELTLYPQKYSETVRKYAAQYEVDENIVYTIIRTESGFDPNAVSDANAYGLMQMTEETFLWLKEKEAPKEDIVFEDLFTPEVSIRFGTYYLSVCLARYDGDLSTAAAAYHSGIGQVDTLLENGEYTTNGRVLHTFPFRQMNNYVNKVNRCYQKYQQLYYEPKGEET